MPAWPNCTCRHLLPLGQILRKDEDRLVGMPCHIYQCLWCPRRWIREEDGRMLLLTKNCRAEGRYRAIASMEGHKELPGVRTPFVEPPQVTPRG